MINKKELSKEDLAYLEALLDKRTLTEEEKSTLRARAYYLTEEELSKLDEKPKAKRKYLK